MTAKLTNEQVAALHASGDQLEVVDPSTNRVYVIVDQETLRRAQASLQHEETRAAIKRGNEQAEAGEGMPIEEAREVGRKKLIDGFEQG